MQRPIITPPTDLPPLTKEQKMTLEKVTAKIKKLLAMGDLANNPNETERETALRQANAMMDNYGIESIESGTTEQDFGQRDKARQKTGIAQWKRTVLHNLARLYGCKCITCKNGAETYCYIFGREHYRGVVISMYEYVIDSIMKEATTTHKGKGKMFTNGFKLGAAIAIAEMVKTMLAARKDSTTMETGKALVLVNHYEQETALNNALMREHYPSISITNARVNTGRAGYAEGKEYGSSIRLNDQIGGGTTTNNKRLR